MKDIFSTIFIFIQIFIDNLYLNTIIVVRKRKLQKNNGNAKTNKQTNQQVLLAKENQKTNIPTKNFKPKNITK